MDPVTAVALTWVFATPAGANRAAAFVHVTEEQCRSMLRDTRKIAYDAFCYGPDGKTLTRDRAELPDDSKEVDVAVASVPCLKSEGCEPPATPEEKALNAANEPAVSILGYGITKEQRDYNRYIKSNSVHIFHHDGR